ncbi:hydrogenase maturation nickel metallochaperone HypA/HybF [Alkalihalobacterium elongatum]|uniref:hydrogenase maturation nickel metallochaperone HypA/HybF n=1 Tax=Alkalihalobacterium elongatum TaxID=2675466 RepID=UPI001C1F9FE2|nr:hydrogenase maturation nickel metallochaperone HypA [Alkalihalobacterium elongatum]
MHEMSLMADIIQIVSEDAAKRGIKKVKTVEVVVGDFSNVLPDALDLAFLYLSQHSSDPIIDQTTTLTIIREVAKAKCKVCELEFEPDFRIAYCPKCELPTSVLLSGETFKVESYEGSDDHEY